MKTELSSVYVVRCEITNDHCEIEMSDGQVRRIDSPAKTFIEVQTLPPEPGLHFVDQTGQEHWGGITGIHLYADFEYSRISSIKKA